MQIVIDIPEKEYQNVMCGRWEGNPLANYIETGISLPKGHGRLIDADALPLNDIDDANYGSNYIRIAPTIIEADKGGD